MATLPELLSNLDANIQVRGHQFEHICKWYLENDPKYRLELKKIWLWKNWPNKWGPDAGIDLVGKTYDNKLWAIQSKAYDEKYSIKKTDIDTFLSESSRQVFSYRLLIVTTNFIGRTALRTLDDQEKSVGRILLSDLQKSEVDWPESPLKLVSKPHLLKQPLPHQQKAISDVLNGFSEHDRGQLVMASGTGKTLVALWISEQLKSQRTLILMPSLSLLAQTLREWTANTSQSFHYLPVCSDDTVRGEVRLISKTSDLGLPVTTDPSEIAAFLRQWGFLVVFATYQSSPVVAKAFTHNNVPDFDLTIADEAHRCAGLSSGPFAKILDATAIKARKRLFMTATPRYFTDRVLKEAEMEDFEIASMDDENKFGPVFHKLSFSEAIKQDLLSDYQVVVIGVDNPTYRRYAQQGTFVTTDGKEVTDARTLASQIVVAKAMRKYDLKRIVSFHSRIKRAKDFSDKLTDVIKWMPEKDRPSGSVWSAHVSGEMPSGRRDVFLNRLRHLEDGERGLLANARCLTEGVDVPTLDGIVFVEPRHSQLDIVQAVGRAIRKAPDKRIGTIILPVFIDANQDYELALDSSVFKPVWDVLKALRAHDDILGYELDKLRRQLGSCDMVKITLPENVIIDFPTTVEQSFVEAFCVKAVEWCTVSWEFWFGLLERYVRQKGHARISTTYVTEEGYNLGTWIREQRRAYRKGKLSPDRQKLLEKLFLWTWDYSRTRWQAQWQVGIEYLQSYVELIGHARVPTTYVTEDGYNLGIWVYNRRISYQKGKLTLKQQKSLEQLPEWTWSIKSNDKKAVWFTAYMSLRTFSDAEGHTSLPYNYVTKDGFHLGGWVDRQRLAHLRGKLPKEKQQMLEKIPHWTWYDHRVEWKYGIERLREFARRWDHTNVPNNYVTDDGYSLGQWIAEQRSVYRKGEMSKRRQKVFEQMPGWLWDPLWLSGVNYLRDYVQRYGNANVPENYVTKDGFHLGKWVYNQRWANLGIGGILLPKQRQMLKRLSGWSWDLGIKQGTRRSRSTAAGQ